MDKYKTALLILIFLSQQTFAQNKIEGVYSLTGIHDMAANFQFNKDGNFQFEYFYGASERTASGTFNIVADTIKLKSDKLPGKDFTVSKQSKKGNGFTIIIKDENPVLINQIRCIFVKGETMVTEDVTSSNGKLYIENVDCNKIYLQHPFFPDIATLIKDTLNTNNYFEVTLNPSLQQVSFKGIDFVIDGDKLHCLPNYFMPFEEITFVKQ